MGLFDHADDLRQNRVAAHLGGAIGQAAGAINRAADESRTADLFHRHRLTGDHAFIDIGLPIDDNAVGGDLLAGAEVDDVAGFDLFQGQFDDGAVALHPCAGGAQAHELGNRGPGAPLGAGLKIAAQQDQRDDHGGGFEIDHAAAFGQQPRRKERGDRVEPRRPRSECHERVHIRRALRQRRQAIAIEMPPRPCQHEGGEEELDEPACLRPDGRRDPMVKSGHQMAAHLKHKNGQGERGGQQGHPFEVDGLRFLTRRGLGGARLGRVDAGGIARLCRRIAQGGQKIGVFQCFDSRLFAGEVDRGREHPRHRKQRAFHTAQAGGAGHV